ncbi:hypothetical protein Tco_1146164 [Tanacetum coccineum]
MQGASCTQRKVSMVPFVFSIPFVLSWGGSISSDSFLPSILLLVVIIVTVVIVVVILIVIVVVIVGVVVVVGGVSSILKLSFVIIGFLRRIVFYYLLHQPLGYGDPVGLFYPNRLGVCILFWTRTSFVEYSSNNGTLSSSAHLLTRQYHQLIGNQLPDGSLSHRYNRNFLKFKTSRDRYRDNGVSDPIGGLVFLGTPPTHTASGCTPAFYSHSSRTGLLPSGRVDLTDDEDPTDEDGDTGMGDLTGVSVSLVGEISSGGKKSQE